MSKNADRLYELLPAIYRIRDAEQGYPLRDLLSLIENQVAALEENLDQLYDDQFIETCADWVAPYIGDLIGYRGLHGVVPKVSSPRADVANTIRYRRRKGTAAMLEQMARDVTDWPARVVELFQSLGWTQYMNHVRPEVHYAPDLRDWQRLLWRDTAFDTLAHTIDVRRIDAGAARHNIPNIGVFLWRVRAFPLTRSPAAADPVLGGGRYFRFNSLGSDMPLYNNPETEEEITHLAEPRNVPLPLGRRWLKTHLDDYYGPGKSLLLELAGNPPQPVPREQIRICNLSDIKDGGGKVIDWAHQPPAGSGQVAIDPVLGRIAFADAPASTPLTSFHYGFTIAIGGGEYERGDSDVHLFGQVKGGEPLQPLLDQAPKDGGEKESLEATDSHRYEETPSIKVDPGKTLELRAANGARPLLKSNGDIALDLGAKATLILDGWVIAGGTLTLPAYSDVESRYLILRDCTLVPGPRANKQADDPCLVVSHAFASVEMERCISAPLHIAADATLAMKDCIIDASNQELIAYRGPGSDPLAPGAAMSLESCTVIGKVHTRQLTLASDSIFAAALAAAGETWKASVWADRLQQGCLRFSYVPAGSRTPHGYLCQPQAGDLETGPHFTSLHYGDVGYCQLRESTSGKIRRGAHDESEMGVMHGLYQAQRETNLRVRLEEYLRFGLEAGIIFGS